jgi:hypothetical protein
MQKLIRLLAAVVGLGLIVSLYIWFFVYNKPHRNFEKEKAEVVLQARQCFNDFSSGKNDLGGKVIEIYGVPSGVEDNDSVVLVVFSFNQGMFGDEGIRCGMLPKFQSDARKLNLNDTVFIKGFCTGYNGTDVIINNCSIATP